MRFRVPKTTQIIECSPLSTPAQGRVFYPQSLTLALPFPVWVKPQPLQNRLKPQVRTDGIPDGVHSQVLDRRGMGPNTLLHLREGEVRFSQNRVDLRLPEGIADRDLLQDCPCFLLVSCHSVSLAEALRLRLGWELAA